MRRSRKREQLLPSPLPPFILGKGLFEGGGGLEPSTPPDRKLSLSPFCHPEGRRDLKDLFKVGEGYANGRN